MNIGTFMFNISQALMTLGQKLYDMFTMDISIKWVKSILNFFGAEISMPETISLYWILASGGAAVLLVFVVYRMFK